MRWLKSATEKSWVANGLVIPSNSGTYINVNEDTYGKILANTVFKSLIDHGHVIVLNEEPAELKNNLNNLQETNITLKAQIESLKEQLNAKGNDSLKAEVEAAKAETEALKAEAVKELEEKQAEIEKLKKQLAKAKAKGDE